jgi:DNA-binding response OmpR family regulator
MNDAEAADAAAMRVEALMKKVGAPTTLAEPASPRQVMARIPATHRRHDERPELRLQPTPCQRPATP